MTTVLQVYELHRLYQIQKILMSDMVNGRDIELNQRGRNFKNATSLTQSTHHNGVQEKPEMKFDLEQPAEEKIAESDGEGVLELIDEPEIELTLGPSSFNSRKKVERPLNSDSGHSLSSSSTGSSHVNKTSSRSHHGGSTRSEELSGGVMRLNQKSDSVSGCQSGIRNSLDVKEDPRQERLKQPPWLFQVLSLNMT